MAQDTIAVPNIGDSHDVDVVEVLVKPGARIEKEQTLIVLESEKASMDVPSPRAGVVKEIKIKVGDKASEGTPILVLEDEAAATEDAPQDKPSEKGKEPSKKPAESKSQSKKADAPADAKVVEEPEPDDKPDTDDESDADDESDDQSDDDESDDHDDHDGGAAEDDADKSSEQKNSGKDGQAPANSNAKIAAQTRTYPPSESIAVEDTKATTDEGSRVHAERERSSTVPYASPAVRRVARELGVDLSGVHGSARGGRITKQDVQNYVKQALRAGAPAAGGGMFTLPDAPEIDFSQFGPISKQPLTKIQRLTGKNLHRSWVTIPHVTQFDEADITDLEEFRKQIRAEQPELKLTLLTFFLKAVVYALKRMPRLNSSLDKSGENLVLKQYFHIGVAVDTPNGLVVPVIRDVDRKTLSELANELTAISERARAKRLAPGDMQGASFTISSLGGIGGTAFTPIINPPEVAVLGISRAHIAPVHRDGAFVPRLLCPLSLSYDHRVVDGADGARFTTILRTVLGDVRQLLL